jgi:glycosyltransferase involved in cell wall biosynthesis
MKVLHILNSIEFSGAEIMLKDASEYFLRHGIESTILSTGECIGPYADKLMACGYTIKHIPFRKSFRYFLKLCRFLKENRYAVIHIHPERAYFYHAFVARVTTGAKIIRTYHDVFFQYGKLKKQIRKFQRLLARRVMHVVGIAIGASVRQVEFLEFSNPTVVINNWIDDTIFRVPSGLERSEAKKEFGLRKSDFVICTVGTCNKKKRHLDIFDAIASVKQFIPSIVLLHRGTGPDTKDEINYVKKIGIEEHVRFLGYIEYMPKIYWASDCFALASKWEGLGDVIIEAIACGLPVILYDGWGMQDFKPLSEEHYGYWLDKETGKFGDAIVDFSEKSNVERIRMQQNARKMFESKFSRKKSLERLISIYNGD